MAKKVPAYLALRTALRSTKLSGVCPGTRLAKTVGVYATMYFRSTPLSISSAVLLRAKWIIP